MAKLIYDRHPTATLFAIRQSGAIWLPCVAISTGSSASVYECFPFIWPYNALRADVTHLKRGSVTLPRVADYTSKWFP